MEQYAKAPVQLGGALISARVVDRLLEEMAHGAYAGMDRLPPELELAARLGVSRTVVRDALSELERSGYLERVRGIGTVVNRDVVHLGHRMDQKLEFHKMIEAMGRTPHTDHLMVTRQTADEALARDLDLQPGETVLVVGKRMLADDAPVLFCTDVMPLSLFGGRLDGIDFSRPIFDVLQDHCDIQTTSTVARLHAVTGEAALRRLLGLTPDKALLELEETCYSRLCRPVVRSRTLYTDFFDFALVRKLV